MFRETNSWGAARWRVLRLRDGQAALFFQVPTEGFTRNVPAFDELSAHSTIEKSLNLDAPSWRSGDDGERSIRSGDLLAVIYDVPFSDEARSLGVWHGAVMSPLFRVQ